MSSSYDDPQVTHNNLSNVEVHVLSEVAKGIAITEVALRLYIYEDAVRRHLRSAMKKAGVRDHAEAIAWAKRHATAVASSK
jgi:DNA-binding NarL/FixJ family response regulator